MSRRRKQRGSSSHTVNYYREECKTTHGFDISKCDDDCNIVEVEYDVSGDVSAYVPAKTYGPPENCYPAEGGEVEDITVTLDGKDVDLDSFSAAEQEKMAEMLAEAAADDDGGDEDYEMDREDFDDFLDGRGEP